MNDVVMKVGDPVLIWENDFYVNQNRRRWKYNIFSHYENDPVYKHACVFGTYEYCIPFKGNEHLLGTDITPESLGLKTRITFEFGEKVEVRNYSHEKWTQATYIHSEKLNKGLDDSYRYVVFFEKSKRIETMLECRKLSS